ncbi:MAG: YidB family protein [Pseudomonadota bacterium]
MNIQQLLDIGAQSFISALGEQGGGLSLRSVTKALSGLLPGDGSSLDLSALISKMDSGGLAAMAQSWLSSGGNQSIDAGQILNLFGQDQLKGFADQLGIGEQGAVTGLQAALPDMIDQASPNGTLESLGGVSGVLDMAGKLFGK